MRHFSLNNLWADCLGGHAVSLSRKTKLLSAAAISRRAAVIPKKAQSPSGARLRSVPLANLPSDNYS